MPYVTETEIANRALQKVGAKRIADGALWTESSRNASEVRACYHILRRAEMRRNLWRFSIRTNALRPMGTDSRIVSFGSWATGTTYAVNDVIVGTDGITYFSRASSNVGHDPVHDDGTYWVQYFGTDVAAEYVTTYAAARTYAKSNHCIGSDSNGYVSLVDANIGNDPVSDGGVNWVLDSTAEADDTSYFVGELVYVGDKVWLSLVAGNEDDPISGTNGYWLDFATEPTVAKANLLYPLGAGPLSNSSTRNAYRLPVGFLRRAPQLPLAGQTSWLGAPSTLPMDDWQFEDQYFTSAETGVIAFRFGADVSRPAFFDPLFVEFLAARVAFEVCEPLTQSTTKLSGLGSEYKQFRSDAILVNGIETGPEYPPTDEYLSVRL